MSGGLKALVKRTLALLILAALVVQMRPGGWDAMAWLRSALWPVEPGVLTVEMRPDLAGPVLKSYDYVPPKNRFPPHRFEIGGEVRQFYALPARGAEGLPPLVILLHGAGRDGRAMLDMWANIAAKGVFLVAPDASGAQWNTGTDGPDFLADVLDEAAAIQPFDRNRVYLYGHSAGANMALYLGNCTDFPVRAVAVHAGVLPDCPGTAAWRPQLIQIGDRDESFPLVAVERAAQQISALGSPVTLRVIPGHDHWFYNIGPALADEAWAFFAR
ncbi:alpha/beta hydrolase family esterase [Neogemmobacter tilapiae]|uniref:alpha/beta hydrolase family esterase n=1 Tax=Neogemmobacter tilapiae TaxID=875041 RepID=UPI00167AC1AD|nr:alpha/beta fold hydrolase [Gemmobacter tilapiae]